jgi:RNA polymerase sigma-70 factor (ECF subfamily)
VLCDVLRWPAQEVADLLGTTPASVNSSLQRARATLAQAPASSPTTPLSDDQQLLLARYVDAFERYDMEALAALLHDDVTQTMPPYAMWLQGRDDLVAWYTGAGIGCEGSRLLAGQANGCPAFAQYRRDPDGGHVPWALQVVELRDDRIEAIHAFLDTEAFERFGFPPRLD